MRLIYQLGGSIDYGVGPDLDPVNMGDDPQGDDSQRIDTDPVIFDSARYAAEEGEDLSFLDDLDELPVNGDGLDLASITPTLGNVALRKQLDPSVSNALMYLKSIGIKPSSTNDGKHNIGSKHYHGRAFDLGLNTSFGGDMNKMLAFKNNFERLKNTNPAFARLRLVDETERPAGQEVWTGAHYHIELE